METHDRHSVRPGSTARLDALAEAAETLLSELAENYVADKREAKDNGIRVVHVVPRSPACGPLSIGFPETPAIMLRLGRWFATELTACGCDDCRSDPDDPGAELRRLAAAHVEGGLWERVRRGFTGSVLETTLVGAGVRISRQVALSPAEAREARREGFAAAVQWAPWPRRAA